jgi:hypothetical protein
MRRALHGGGAFVPVEQLATGQAFHKAVQSAFLTGLAGAAGFPERRWRLVGERHGRVDLAVEVEGEQMLVIIEIKATNWNKIATDRMMRNLRRHLHQLQGYLDSAVEEMETGRWTGVAGALLYPARPASTETTEVIERIAGEQAIMIAWYEDADWRLPI